MKFSVLIADDEAPARAKLRRLLDQTADFDCVGEAADGVETIRLVAELRPQILMLDIEMPPPNGLAVLRAVRHEWLPLTVFTTAHAQHALEAFNLQAVDYLLKPFSRERLATALARVRVLASARAALNQPTRDLLARGDGAASPVETLLVQDRDRHAVVRVAEIVRAEAAANYVVLHTARGRHVLRKTMRVLARELDPAQFFRASRFAIINLRELRDVLTPAPKVRLLRMSDGAEVRMTRPLRDIRARMA